MAITLSGRLYDPYGNALPDASIRFRAARTGTQIIANYSAEATTDSSGDYTISVRFGTYHIDARQSDSDPWYTIARSIPITSETSSTNVNDLIVAYMGADDATPEIVTEIESIAASATAAQVAAETAAQEAQALVVYPRAIYVNSVSSLEALDSTLIDDGATAVVSGFSAGSQYGGGVFILDKSSSAVADGWSIVGASSGRWIRVYNKVSATMLGLTPGGDFASIVGPYIASGAVTHIVIDVDCEFSSPVDTSSALTVEVETGVTIDVSSGSGMFNVNASPFLLLGRSSYINHVSRVLFFGNDASLTLDGIEVSGFEMFKTSSAGAATLYFPNTITKNVRIKEVTGHDYSTASSAEFILVDWGENSGTENWEVEDLTGYGYDTVFHSQGNGFATGLTVKNFRSYDSTGDTFFNYHWRESDLDLYAERNANPIRAWSGDSRRIDISTKDSITDGVKISQLQSIANVTTYGQGGYGVNLTGGSNHSILNLANEGGLAALKVSPSSSASPTSTMDGVRLNIVTSGHSEAGVVFDQEGIAAADMRRLSMDLIAYDASDSAAIAVKGVGVFNRFDLTWSSGECDDTHAKAVQIDSSNPAQGGARFTAIGVKLDCSGNDMVSGDRAAFPFLLKGCILSDATKLATYSASSLNHYSSCWDEATESEVSG